MGRKARERLKSIVKRAWYAIAALAVYLLDVITGQVVSDFVFNLIETSVLPVWPRVSEFVSDYRFLLLAVFAFLLGVIPVWRAILTTRPMEGLRAVKDFDMAFPDYVTVRIENTTGYELFDCEVTLDDIPKAPQDAPKEKGPFSNVPSVMGWMTRSGPLFGKTNIKTHRDPVTLGIAHEFAQERRCYFVSKTTVLIYPGETEAKFYLSGRTRDGIDKTLTFWVRIYSDGQTVQIRAVENA